MSQGNSLREQLRSLVSEIAEKTEVPDGASFKDLGIDSMMGVEIVPPSSASIRSRSTTPSSHRF